MITRDYFIPLIIIFQMIITSIRMFLLALLIATALGADNQTKEIPTMTVGQIANGVVYKADRFKSYHLISVPSIDKKYLFITLSTEEIYKHLNMSLLIYKQGQQTPLQKCDKQEVDSCYLPKQHLELNQTLFVVVQSDSEVQMTYKLRTYWSDLEHIELNQEIRFMFSEKDQKQIYHLQLEGKQFKELRILIKPETRRYPFDKVKMYGTFGKDSNPSEEHYDFRSFPLWEDSEGVYLFRSEIKDLTMNLILYGMTETVYTMRCEISNKTHSDLALNSKIYEYLQKQQRYLYHIEFKTKEGKYLYQNYVFRVSVFTGDLNFKFYKDEQKSQEITNLNPAMYMGDIQYILKQAEIEEMAPKGLYVDIASSTRISTFMLQFQGRSKFESLELNEHIYQFIQVQKKERAFLKFGKFGGKSTKKDNYDSVVTFTKIEVKGKVGINFFICTTFTTDCLGDNYANYTQPIESQIRQVGTKTTYLITPTQEMFNQVNNVEQHIIILAVLTNKEEQGSSFAAIEYNVGNRPEFLRENKPIQSHVKRKELKVYKYICQDPAVKKLKVYVNLISGDIQAYTFRQVPSEQELKNQKGRVLNGLVEITDRIMEDPVVIVISGVESATFSIVVQTITSEKQQFSYITLSEDVEFKARIAPNHFEVFEIVPISSNIYFNYSSSGAVHVCFLNDQKVCKDQTLLPTLANSGELKIQKFNDRKAYVKIRNPSSSRFVEISTVFRSKNEEHCEPIKVGKLTRQVLSTGKCVYTNLPKQQDYEVMIVHEQYGSFSYDLMLCGKKLNFPRKDSEQERYIISKELINNSCKGYSDYSFALFFIGDVSNLQDGKLVNRTNVIIQYIVQEVNSVISLPDGLGYKGSAKSTEQPIKKFAYKLINQIDTSIVVTSRNKLYFLVKIVESVYRDFINMSLSDFHFSSPTDRYFFLESLHLKISGEQFKKSTCTDCQLLIFLYSKEPVGQFVDYTIEVSQNFFMLEEGFKKQNYLTQNSKAFYGYKAKQKGSIVVEVSDNNMDCAEIYMSSKEYPDQNNYLKRSYDGELVLDNFNKEPTTYYISIFARQNCAYSIGANLVTGERNIFKLERGILSSLSLKEGEVKYFTFKHLSYAPFKILSLHRYGLVNMYLNQTTQEEVSNFMTSKEINYKKFQYKSQHKNRLLLNETSPYFCNGCMYILAVVAAKHTEASLFLGDELTKIPISEEKVINDILPDAGSSTKGEFYPLEKGILEVKVHSGKVQVTVEYQNQEFKEIFEKVEGKQAYNFSLTLKPGYYGSATVVMRALATNTVYSLRIKSIESTTDSKTDVDYTSINPNEANYLFVTERKNCMKGYLKGKDERIFLSFYSSDRDVLNELNISGTLNGQDTPISHDITRNVMSVSFIKAASLEFSKGIPYQLCLSLMNNSLSVAAMQTEDAGTLPQNIQMLVTGKQTYDIYPQGQFLLDVFECRGTAKIAYGNSKTQLQSTKEKVLDVIGMPDQPHAIKIERGYFNILLQVSSPLALIRWLPINFEQEKGIGYYLYSAGSLKYDSAFGQLNFVVKPIKFSSKKTKTSVKNIKYNLYISNNEQDLKEASLCERYLPGSVMQFKAIHEEIITNEFKFHVSKNNIIEKYKEAENLFAVIVADLILQIPDKTEEYYRFVYTQQEVPAELFTPSKLEEYQFIFIIVFLVVLTITLFVCAFLCSRVFVPLLGRLKNRMLVEEGGLQNSKDKDKDKDDMKQDQIEPPPSSDRQNINVLTAPQTEARMS